MSITAMLQRKDWPALRQHFAQHAPTAAPDFLARALLALSAPAPEIDWPHVVADFRQAIALRPDDALLRANLVQALIDSQQAPAAYEEAVLAARQAPAVVPVQEKLGFAAAASGHWDEALAALRRAVELLGPTKAPPAATARLLAQLEAQWWRPIVLGATLMLRPPGAGDAAFLDRVFGDRDFMRHFHRFQPGGLRAVQHFVELARQAPTQSHRMDWIVFHDDQPAGLAGLVDIDFPNRRGEILVGFPRLPHPQIALRATAAVLDFGFRRLMLEKVLSYVYGDNRPAQDNTLHLGFRQEGLLRSHITAEGGRQDLYVNGMLRGEFEGSRLLRRVMARAAVEGGGSREG